MSFDPKKLSDAIDRIAARRQISINAWATKAGLVPGTFRAIKTGRTRSVGLDTIYKMAEAVDVSVWELLGEELPWKARYEELRAVLVRIQELDAARASLFREVLDVVSKQDQKIG